jgi:hypothetical protein
MWVSMLRLHIRMMGLRLPLRIGLRVLVLLGLGVWLPLREGRYRGRALARGGS